MNIPAALLDSVKTRLFAGAFIRYQNEVILMQRSPDKKIAPGSWSGIGGHMEPHEINSPITACLREIEEETGIVPAQINTIDLRYFVLLNAEETVDSIYYFSVVLKEKCLLRQSSEGTLHWIKLQDGADRPMTSFIRQLYLHWVDNLFDTSLHCLVGSGIYLLPGRAHVF